MYQEVLWNLPQQTGGYVCVGGQTDGPGWRRKAKHTMKTLPENFPFCWSAFTKDSPLSECLRGALRGPGTEAWLIQP